MVEPMACMTRSVLRYIDKDCSKRDDGSWDEKPFGRVHERRLEGLWVAIEAERNANYVDDEENYVQEKEYNADRLESMEAEGDYENWFVSISRSLYESQHTFVENVCDPTWKDV